MLNLIRDLQKHHKSLLIHTGWIYKQHSELEIDTVSCSWKDPLKGSFHHWLWLVFLLSNRTHKTFISRKPGGICLNFTDPGKTCLFHGMVSHEMARICCCHQLFLVFLCFWNSQQNECQCPNCRHLHLSKWLRSPFIVNRNLVNKVMIM